MDLTWKVKLRIDPLPALLNTPDMALTYAVRKYLLGEPVEEPHTLWKLPEVEKIIRLQHANGSWQYGSVDNPSVPGQNYALLETYRNLRELVEKYGMTRGHPTIQKTVDYILRQQTDEGDIRGILGNQYMPYYMGAILELVIKAGYTDDPRVSIGLDWLLSMRQDDGGWIVPTQVVPCNHRTDEFWSGKPVQPVRNLLNSHLATGMVLRAFAVHPAYYQRPEVLKAADCLKTRILEPDRYNDRRSVAYWLKFQFPFWWTSLVSALDTLTQLGYPYSDTDITRGLEWVYSHQAEDGLWPTGYDKGRKALSNRLWVGMAFCRVIHDLHQ